MLSDPRSHVIVDSTNQMAHAMGLRLVAEGVEDAEIAEALARLGIDVLQGYHIGRPMPQRRRSPSGSGSGPPQRPSPSADCRCPD